MGEQFMREHAGEYLLNLSLVFFGTGVLGGLFSDLERPLKLGLVGISLIFFVISLAIGFGLLTNKEKGGV